MTARHRRRRSRRGVTLARAIDRGLTHAVCNVAEAAAVRVRCSEWSCADVDVVVDVDVGVVADAAVTATDCVVRHADTRWR